MPFLAKLIWSHWNNTQRVSNCYYPIKRQRKHSQVLQKLSHQYSAMKIFFFLKKIPIVLYIMLLSNFGMKITGSVQSQRQDFAFNWYLLMMMMTTCWWCWWWWWWWKTNSNNRTMISLTAHIHPWRWKTSAETEQSPQSFQQGRSCL